jgi:hypothetical protein
MNRTATQFVGALNGASASHTHKYRPSRSATEAVTGYHRTDLKRHWQQSARLWKATGDALWLFLLFGRAP